MRYEIRAAERQDLDQLVSLCQAHAHYEGHDYDPTGKKRALDYALFSTSAELKAQVVAAKNDLIGYTTFLKQYSTWDGCHYLYMDCLFLKDAYRGLGIGRELLQKVKKEAHTLGCAQVQWQTPVANEKAIKFYRRGGAVTLHKVRCYLDLPPQRP